MQKNLKFYIYYLKIGSGHQKAAEAVRAALQAEYPATDIEILDPFSQEIKVLPSLLELGLISSNYLLPNVYEKVWKEGNKPAAQMVRRIELLQRILKKNLDPSKNNIVVATHGLPCLIASALKQQQLIHRVYGVITDYGVHSFWSQADADGFFCGHPELTDTLYAQGIARTRLHATGIPVHKEFSSIPAREEQSRPESLKALFIAGGMRGGPYLEIERSVLDIISTCEQYGPPQMHLTIITGKNQHLFHFLKLLQPTLKLSLSIHGFITNMYQFMAENDVIITKPGGLITAESLAAGLGMVLLKSGPGQESANEEFLLRHGAALPGNSAEILSDSMQALHDTSMVQKLRQSAASIGNPNAAQQIASIIKDSLLE